MKYTGSPVEIFAVIDEENGPLLGGSPHSQLPKRQTLLPPAKPRLQQQQMLRSFAANRSAEIVSPPSHDDNGSLKEDDALIAKNERLVPDAPDGGYGWVIVFTAFLSNFVLDGISVSQGALMEDIRKDSGIVNITGNVSSLFGQILPFFTPPPVYEITVAMYGLISAVLFCATRVAGPLVSVMLDKYGFRKVTVTGSFLAATGIFLSWAGSRAKPNIWVTIACFGGITGLGFGMMFQPSVIIIGMYFDKWLPLANGIAMMGTGFGTIIFPPLLAYISKTWSWKEAYLFQAAIALFSVSFVLLYAPLPKRPSVGYGATGSNKENRAGKSKINGDSPAPGENFAVNSKRQSTMRSLLVSPSFLLISMSSGIAMLGIFAPYAFLVDRAMKEISGVDRNSATYLLSIVGIANTTGRLIFGLISCHPWVDFTFLSNSALILGGIAIMLIPLTTTYYEMVIICVVFGFAFAIITVLRPIVVMKLVGLDNFNTAFGIFLPFMGIGTVIGNPLGGWLKDCTGTYDISFYAAGGYLGLAGIMGYPLLRLRDWENRRKPSGDAPDYIEILDKEEQRVLQRRCSLSVSLPL